MKSSNRRSFFSNAAAAAALVAAPAAAQTSERLVKKVHYRDGKKPEKTPLFNGVISYGNLVFIAGIGAHFQGDIKAHTEHVLEEVKKNLERPVRRWTRCSR